MYLINDQDDDVKIRIKFREMLDLIWSIEKYLESDLPHYKEHGFELFLNQKRSLIDMHKNFSQIHMRIDIHENFMKSYKGKVEGIEK